MEDDAPNTNDYDQDELDWIEAVTKYAENEDQEIW
jgi:hypothetical protein